MLKKISVIRIGDPGVYDDSSSPTAWVISRAQPLRLQIGLIAGRVCDSSFREPAAPQNAGVAVPACSPIWRRVIAGVRHRVVDAQGDTAADDLALSHVDQGSDQARSAVFDSALRSLQDHLLKSIDEGWSAIGVTAVINGVYANPDLFCAACLGQTEGKGQEDRVTRWNVRDRNPRRAGGILRDSDVVRERAATEDAEVERKHHVLDHSDCPRHLSCRSELDPMPLPVDEGDGVTGSTLASCHGEDRSGVEASGQEDDGVHFGESIAEIRAMTPSAARYPPSLPTS